MGTFKDSLKKWFFTQGTQPTIAENTRVPLLDASGEPIGSASPTEIYQQMPFLTGNVGLAYASTTKLFLAKSVTANLAVAGVWIIEGGKMLIVAKDHSASMAWAENGIGNGGTGYVAERSASADMAGETKTQTLYTNKGDMAIAAKYALEYAPAGLEDNANYGTGKWWLPSIGEMLMIFSHIQEVDYLLELIGGEPISANETRNYHTSTEASPSKYFQFRRAQFGGYVSSQSKTGVGYVRPVCALY